MKKTVKFLSITLAFLYAGGFTLAQQVQTVGGSMNALTTTAGSSASSIGSSIKGLFGSIGSAVRGVAQSAAGSIQQSLAGGVERVLVIKNAQGQIIEEMKLQANQRVSETAITAANGARKKLVTVTNEFGQIVSKTEIEANQTIAETTVAANQIVATPTSAEPQTANTAVAGRTNNRQSRTVRAR